MSTVPTSFLVYKDFSVQIKTEDLIQILDESNANVEDWTDLSQYTQNVLIAAEQQAIEEISSYIRGRYLTQEVFAPTQVYSSGTTYFGKNLVIYNEPNFTMNGITATTQVVYNVGDQFNYQGIIYSANTAISGGTIDPLPYSTYVTEQDALYFANLPVAEYSQNTSYQKGNLVWFEDNIYQAKNNIQGKTPATSQNLELRYGVPAAQMYLGYYTIDFDTQPNPLPTINSNNWDLYNGVAGWFTGTTYYFSGVNPTQNTTYWTKGDNRNRQVVLYLIDILLYHLHSRINPNQIPMLRKVRYNGDSPAELGGAIGWLKSIQKGRVSLNCPEIVQTQGLSIRFGSTPKNNNSF